MTTGLIDEMRRNTENVVQNIDRQEVAENKDTLVEKTTIEQGSANNKNTEEAPQKTVATQKKVEETEEAGEVEEKLVSCLSYDGTMAKLSKSDCDALKQANALIERAVGRYNDCVSTAKTILSNAEDNFHNQLKIGYDSSLTAEYNRKIDQYNQSAKECVEERNNQIKKLAK
jgi:hypothetical protein